jgi:protein phosphatase
MRYAGKSSPGKKRSRNEDRFLIKDLQPGCVLIALADGLGGQPAGDVAAQAAIDCLDAWEPPPDAGEEDLAAAILEADRRVTHLAGSDPSLEYMGTTLTLALANQRGLLWAHVGDARIYRLGRNGLEQVTTDQTMARFLVEEGEITDQEASAHPMRHLLEQSLGCGDCEPARGFLRLEPGETILICSDGLHSEIGHREIEAILALETVVGDKVDRLLAEADRAGGRDNITALVLEC